MLLVTPPTGRTPRHFPADDLLLLRPLTPCGAGANRYATINDALNYYNLSAFRTSLYCAGLSGSISLGQPASITVFAPTNAAFASLLKKQNITMKVRTVTISPSMQYPVLQCIH